MHWNTLVLIICVMVALFAVLKEYRRDNKQRLGLRMAATLAAIAALTAIALPLTYTSALKKTVNEAVLITTGFKKDSLVRYKFDTIYTMDATIKNQYPKAKLVTADQLKQVTPAISQLHLFGYGLPEDELKQLDSIPVVFYPEPAPKGIIAANWPFESHQGEPLVVQGKYHNTGNGGVRLVLKELNTTVDSMLIKKQGNEDFELTSVPKSTGRLTDRLIVLQGNDTLQNESVPLIVEPVQPLKVLMLAASPAFENKFLKNWLAGKNFGVAVRSAISKDKFSTEFTNLQQIPLTHLTADVLDKFDLLIADRQALQTLNTADQASLNREISQNGLGLIIRADTVFKTGALFQTDFPVYKAAENNPKPLAIQLQGAKSVSKASNTGQLFIRDRADVQALACDVQKRLLATLTLAGSGKVVCTTLDNTYSWMLAGNKDDYADFWSLLIGKAAKTPPATENWNIINPYPTIDRPATLQLETAQQPGQLILDNESTSPGQNEMLPFEWQSTFWAGKTGWLSVNYTGGSPAWVYIYKPADWATIKTVNTIAATQKYALGTKTGDVTKQIQQKVKIMVPKVYFYMLLLLCCTFLWAESKLPSGILT